MDTDRQDQLAEEAFSWPWPDSIFTPHDPPTATFLDAPLPVTKPFKTRVDLAEARATIDPSEVDLYEGDQLVTVPQKIMAFTYYIEDGYYET